MSNPNRMAEIEDFFACRRVAVAGVSRNEKDFSRVLFRDLANRGYDVIPINPAAKEIDGRQCYASVAEIHDPVDGVLIMTSSDRSIDVVRDSILAGIPRVWFYASITKGAVDERAVEDARDAGMTVIAGECPFMFLPKSGWYHGLHKLVRIALGNAPAA